MWSKSVFCCHPFLFFHAGVLDPKIIGQSARTLEPHRPISATFSRTATCPRVWHQLSKSAVRFTWAVKVGPDCFVQVDKKWVIRTSKNPVFFCSFAPARAPPHRAFMSDLLISPIACFKIVSLRVRRLNINRKHSSRQKKHVRWTWNHFFPRKSKFYSQFKRILVLNWISEVRITIRKVDRL